MEVFVRYHAITIYIKPFKNVLELLIGNRDAPEIQVVFELACAYLSCLFDIEVHKSFSKRFPLDSDLVDNLSLHIAALHLNRRLLLIFTLEPLLVLQMLIQQRILHGIVAEVETFRKMNRRTQPLGKVRIAQIAAPVIRPRIYQFLQILIVEIGVIAKVFQDVFECDVAIVITIDHQKCLPDRFETLLKLDFDLLL